MELKYQKAFSYVADNNMPFLDESSTATPKVEPIKEQPKSTSSGCNMDFGALTNGGISIPLVEPVTESKPKRKSRKPNTTNGPITDSNIDDENSGTDAHGFANEPYVNKYEETTNALKNAVVQIDMGLAELQSDVNQIRNSKTLKSKYTHLANLQATMSNYINTKITAIREINNTISKCNDLEIKRAKELNLAASSQDSDKNIMDMYNAFISMPNGGAAPIPNGAGSLGPTVSQLTMSGGSTGIPLSAEISEEQGFQNYLDNMNPSQRLSMYENDPNIQQVVVYNNETGARYFEVMNMVTGEVIPNVTKRDMMFMEDTTLDLSTGIARNLNLNESYPIVEVGQRLQDSY